MIITGGEFLESFKKVSENQILGGGVEKPGQFNKRESREETWKVMQLPGGKDWMANVESGLGCMNIILFCKL